MENDPRNQIQSLLRSGGEAPAGADPAKGEHPLAAAATAATLQTATVSVGWAGQFASGEFYVEFTRPNGTGWHSEWPAWAYEIARTALTVDKRLWIAYDGVPNGDRLAFVMMLPA